MDYEFYFLKDTGQKEPEILRVMAPSYDNAAMVVARQFGWTASVDSRRRAKEYIDSIDVRPIEIRNLFERSLSTATLP